MKKTAPHMTQRKIKFKCIGSKCPNQVPHSQASLEE